MITKYPCMVFCLSRLCPSYEILPRLPLSQFRPSQRLHAPLWTQPLFKVTPREMGAYGQRLCLVDKK